MGKVLRGGTFALCGAYVESTIQWGDKSLGDFEFNSTLICAKTFGKNTRRVLRCLYLTVKDNEIIIKTRLAEAISKEAHL